MSASAAFHFDAQASLVRKAVTSAGSTVATLDSTTGVDSVEWSILSTDETSDITDWVLSSTTGTSTTITAPSGRGMSARIQCKVNGGQVVDPRTGVSTQGETVKIAKVYIAPEVLAVGETYEHDSEYGYIELANKMIRTASGDGTIYSSTNTTTFDGPGTTNLLTSSAEAMTLQPGQSGSGAGKDLLIGGGAGQTPGTHAAGKTRVELGQTVSGGTSELELLSNGTRCGGIKVDTSSRLYLSNAASISSTGIVAEATSGYLSLKSTNSLVSVEAGTDSYQIAGGSSFYSKAWTNGSAAATQLETHRTSTTADATPTNIGTLTVVNDRVIHIKAEVMAFKDNATVASFERRATYRSAGGALTQVGATTVVHTAQDAALATTAVAFATSGLDLKVQCTGVAATTIRWEVYLTAKLGKG